jgi:hypothetical protein
MHFKGLPEKEKEAAQRFWSVLEKTGANMHIDPFELEQFCMNLMSLSVADRLAVHLAYAELIRWDR